MTTDEFEEFHEKKEEQVCTQTIKIGRYNDEDIVNYIYQKYHIKATEINSLNKDALEKTIADIVKVTKASARQIGRITQVPLRFLWDLLSKNKKEKLDAKETK